MTAVAVTVVIPAWVDDRGTMRPDFMTHRLVSESWRNVQPVSASEAADMGRQGVTTMVKATASATEADAHCRVIVDSTTYEVVSVQPWSSLTGALRHVEIVLKRTEG